MPTKATWLFNGYSDNTGKVWGFSETWYTSQGGDALLASMDLVSQRRAQILSRETEIVGYRIGTPNGRAFVVRKSFASPLANDKSNLPVDAVRCQCGITGSDSTKKFYFHDLPDDWIVSNTLDFNRIAAIQQVMQVIVATGFQVRFVNQAAAQANVVGITDLGVVTTQAPHVFVVGNVVQFMNMRDVNGKAVRGTYVISVVPDNTHFTVLHWSGQTVGRSGRARLQAFSFGSSLYLGDQTVVDAGSRKVGRPFFQSRGRVPVRR